MHAKRIAMAADNIDETRGRVVPPAQPRWRTVRFSITQFGLAMFSFGCGAILLNDLLTHDTVSMQRPALSAAFIGFLFVLAIIHLTILGLVLRRSKEANPPAVKVSVSTWSPFQSPEVRDICVHLTPRERDRLASQGSQFGGKIGSLLMLLLVIPAFSLLYSIRVFFVLLGLFIIYVSVMEWRLIRDQQRQVRQTLCATEYARARGYHPDSLRLFSLPWSRKATAGDPSERKR
jgi:hypothetical protein